MTPPSPPTISLHPPPPPLPAALGTQPTTRARSSSTPMQPNSPQRMGSRPTATLSRHQSHLEERSSQGSSSQLEGQNSLNVVNGGGASKKKGRARSASLVTVKEVGAGEGESDLADLGSSGTENWQWVDAKGAWVIHPILILLGKFLIDAIPGIGADLSWSLVNCGYMAISYLIFHLMVGLPYEDVSPTGGVYDDLTLWEQIDDGAQYTPAKKYLTSVPIGLFLISTHYSSYDPVLFFINFIALTLVLIPKLPILHRLRFSFLEPYHSDVTPAPSRPGSPTGVRRRRSAGKQGARVKSVMEVDEGEDGR